MHNLTCPKCSILLKKLDSGMGVLWACGSCQGRAVTIAMLRKQVDRAFINRLWQEVRTAPLAHRHGLRACPSCSKPMIEVAVGGVSDEVEIDACRLCQFVWFDANETAQLPVLPPQRAAEKLSPEGEAAVAMARATLQRERAEREERKETVGELWDWWSIADWVLSGGRRWH